ncbi:hypothetical protein CA831_13225, partial [Burkholderia multivorans]
MHEAERPPFDHRAGERGQHRDRDELAAHVERTRLRRRRCGRTIGRNPGERGREAGRTERQIDEEDAAPAERGDQRAAEH